MLSYCLVCKKIADTVCAKKIIIKDGGLKIKSLCTVCGNKKVRYVSKWSRFLDSLVINYKHEQRK